MKGHDLYQLVGWNQKALLRFDLKKHRCSWPMMDFFDVYVMHHGAQPFFGAFPNILYLE